MRIADETCDICDRSPAANRCPRCADPLCDDCYGRLDEGTAIVSVVENCADSIAGTDFVIVAGHGPLSCK